MSATHPLTPGRPARPSVLDARIAPACLKLAVVEALIRALLASLLGLRTRPARAWHPIPPPSDSAPTPRHSPVPRSPHDGTHLVCEHPILWVIGPGPNRGLRPLPRPLPPPHAGIPRSAQVRAPPRGVHAPAPETPLRPGAPDRAPNSCDYESNLIRLRSGAPDFSSA
jgi:hypothetical protein